MILVYGNRGCMNTQAFLRYISPYIDPMKKRNITVAVVLMDDSTTAEKKEFEAAFPGIICTTPAEGDSSIWNGLEAMGYDDESVTFPVVFLKNAQNKLTYYSTDYPEEPLRVVAGALAMEDDPAEEKTDSSKDDSRKTVDPKKNTDPKKTVDPKKNTDPEKTVDPGKKTAKARQPMTVKAKTVRIKYSKLKKKAQTVKIRKALTVKKAKGKVTYQKKKGNKKITVNQKSGKIKIKKGLKKGTYPVKIKVTAAGTKDYNKGSRTVSVKIKVK